MGKVGIDPGGVWKPDVSYPPLTSVLYEADGCGYVSLISNIGVTPGSNDKVWKIIASSGKSLYELAVKHGQFNGTEQEFVQYYKDTLDAAIKATQSAQESTNGANQSINDIKALGELINAAEIDRNAAEASREIAERVRCEKDAIIEENEALRSEAERERQNASAAAVQACKASKDAADAAAIVALTSSEKCENLKSNIETDWLPSQQEAIELTLQRAVEAADLANEAAENVEQKVEDIPYIKRLLGYVKNSRVINMELGENGKYVKCSTHKSADNADFAISKPFEVDACSELLIKTGYNPSDASHSALDISVISIYEEMERVRTVQKADSSGNPLYYVVTVGEDGSETVTTDESTVVSDYPVYTQEVYTETRYLPNNEDRYVAIPDSEYYVANIPQSCKVVVSYKPGVTDMAVIIEKHGALANLISQVFGIYEHRTMVEAMVSLAARVDALESRRGIIGNAKAGTLDVTELTKCLYPTILRGHGVPAASNIPDNLPEGLPWDGVPVFIGQLYINLDATSGGLYYATGHDSVADWKQA